MPHPNNPQPTAAPDAATANHAAWWRLQLPASWLVELLLWTTGATLALLLATLVGLWWWSGQAQSLPQTLQWASNLLRDPATGTSPLAVTGAQGSVRGGGHIEHLRWQHQGLDVELHGLQWRWPEQLWHEVLVERRLRLEQLQVQRLRVHDQSPPNPNQRTFRSTRPARMRFPTSWRNRTPTSAPSRPFRRPRIPARSATARSSSRRSSRPSASVPERWARTPCSRRIR